MIANITTGSQLIPLINYHESKIKENQASVFTAENTAGVNLEDQYEVGKKLLANYAKHSIRKDKIFHVSISFEKTDQSKLDHNKIKELMKTYLEGLGFPQDLPFLGYQHHDTNNYHFHIVTTTVDESGKSFNLSHNFRKSQRISRKVEKQFGLYKVSSVKDAKVKSEIERPTGIGSDQIYIDKCLYDLLHVQKLYSATSLRKELKKLKVVMELNNNHVVNSTPDALVHQGFIFYLKDERYKRRKKAIPSSQLKMFPSNKAERNGLFANNRVQRLKIRDEIRTKMTTTLERYDHLNSLDLTDQLSKQSIQVNLRFNKNRLVGVKFVHLPTGMIFTGEQIGKQFTAGSMAQKVGNDIASTITLQGKTEMQMDDILSIINNFAKEDQIKVLALCGYELNTFSERIAIKSQFQEEGEFYKTNINADGTEFSLSSDFRRAHKLFTVSDDRINAIIENRTLVVGANRNPISSSRLIEQLLDNLSRKTAQINNEDKVSSTTDRSNNNHQQQTNLPFRSFITQEVDSGIDESLPPKGKKKRGRRM